MKSSAAKRRWAWGSLFVSVPFIAWTAMAVHFQLGAYGWWVYGIPALIAVIVLWASFLGRARAWLVLAIMMIMVAVAWAQIRPLQIRDWAPELSRGVVAQQDGSILKLSNVRDFRWRTPDEAEQRWIDKTVDLDKLETIDFVRTTWKSEKIAHTMISFGFSDGQYVVFSAEIRRESHEKFSELGGFFKKFELVLIGATEEDIVKLRTHARNESVSLYRLNLTPEQRRALFLSYVGLGNELAAEPRWYQTITTNCTTVIWRLARTVDGRIPMDWRVLLSGYTQDYLYDIGVINNDRPFADIRAHAPVTELARKLPPETDYSKGIRSGLLQ